MQLDETARERLEDIRDLQPTSNAELRDRWGMDSGKEVAAYLRDEVGEHTYRDDDSRIRAVDASPDGVGDGAAESSASDPSPENGLQHRISQNEASDEGDTPHETDEPRKTLSERQQPTSESTLTENGSDNVVTTPVATEMLEATAEEAYREGIEHGTEYGATEAVRDEHQASVSDCPGCGGIMVYPGGGTKYETAKRAGGIFFPKYHTVELEEDDRYCYDCDLVVESDGRVIPGNQFNPDRPVPERVQ